MNNLILSAVNNFLSNRSIYEYLDVISDMRDAFVVTDEYASMDKEMRKDAICRVQELNNFLDELSVIQDAKNNEEADSN
jgi:hypothetical protein